jgi:hypothetical protein
VEILKRANRWAAEHPIEFAAIQMAINTMIALIMGGHPTRSTTYVMGEIAKISKEHNVPKAYVKVWVKQELSERGIRYVHLE